MSEKLKKLNELTSDLLLETLKKCSLKEICEVAKENQRFFWLVSMFVIPRREVILSTVISECGTELALNLLKYAKNIKITEELSSVEHMLLAAKFVSTLTLESTTAIIDVNIQENQFEHLIVLNINRCNIKYDNLRKLLAATGPKFEEFHWNKSTLHEMKTFDATRRLSDTIGVHGINLKTLLIKYDYEDSHAMTTDKSKSLYEGLLKLKQLERLTIAGLVLCDCANVVRVITEMNSLTELSIKGNDVTEHIDQRPWNFKFNCPLMDYYRKPFKNAVIRELAKQPQLTRFCVMDLFYLSTNDLRKIAVALPNLEEFEIENETRTFSEGICEFVRHAPKLKTLILHEFEMDYEKQLHQELEAIVKRRKNKLRLRVKIFVDRLEFVPAPSSPVQVEFFWK